MGNHVSTAIKLSEGFPCLMTGFIFTEAERDLLLQYMLITTCDRMILHCFKMTNIYRASEMVVGYKNDREICLSFKF